MGSVHKTYHKSESWVSGSGLGDIKMLPLIATRAPCRRRQGGEGVVCTPNSPAWESRELNVASNRAKYQDRKQRSGDGREATIDFYSYS